MRNVMNKKQRVMKKGCKKHLMKEKKTMFFMREIFFLKKKNGRFFGTQKRDKTNKRSICSQKFWD